MHEYEVLKLLVIIFGVSALVVFLLHRVDIPPLVGFIVSGVIIGPYGLGIAHELKDIELLAEVGVVLLLFVIGIEFSLKNLLKIRKAVLRGGGIQVGLTIVLTAFVAYLMTGSPREALFYGFLMALSSTAIVIKMLAERGEIDTPHGRMMVGILIFQDLCVVLLMLITPALGGDVIDIFALFFQLLKAALFVAVVLVAARWMVPLLFHQIVHSRSRELFVTTVILMCLGTAMLASRFGLSIALGAFLAGLVISESEYSHQAMSDILPFKDSFIGLFFVSIGMIMDVGFIIEHWLKVASAVLAIFAVKVVTGALASLASGSHIKTATHTGLGLAQIGEFSFVLAGTGRAVGLMPDDLYQIFISSSIVTMLATPFVMKAAPAASGWSAELIGRRIKRVLRFGEGKVFPQWKSGHVIIVGFGLNGRNLARVLKRSGVPYVILEMNNDTVRRYSKEGEPIYFGDGTSREILEKMGARNAKVLVVAISDAASTRFIVRTVKKANPDLCLLVRTRYTAEVEDLKELGADEVIPEEFETSIEIFSRVLHYFSVPRNVINDYIEETRKDNYSVLRMVDYPRRHLAQHHEYLEGIETEIYLIKPGSRAVGRSIVDLGLRKETRVTIIAVMREKSLLQNPYPEYVFRDGDILVLIGKREDIHHAMAYLDAGTIEEMES